MPYVMIPVPEEYEQELMSEVLKMSLRKSISAWSPESLRAIYTSCDPAERSLVDTLTRASADGNRLPLTAIEEALHVSSDALEALVTGVNGRCDARSLPWLILRTPASSAGGMAGTAASDLLIITQTAATALLADGIVSAA
ncbi:MAG: hypothetical protein ABIP03_09700 [Aquihabitans sp.]